MREQKGVGEVGGELEEGASVSVGWIDGTQGGKRGATGQKGYVWERQDENEDTCTNLQREVLVRCERYKSRAVE